MTKEQAELCAMYLGRAQLLGQEVPKFVELIQILERIAHGDLVVVPREEVN